MVKTGIAGLASALADDAMIAPRRRYVLPGRFRGWTTYREDWSSLRQWRSRSSWRPFAAGGKLDARRQFPGRGHWKAGKCRHPHDRGPVPDVARWLHPGHYAIHRRHRTSINGAAITRNMITDPVAQGRMGGDLPTLSRDPLSSKDERPAASTEVWRQTLPTSAPCALGKGPPGTMPRRDQPLLRPSILLPQSLSTTDH